MKLGKNIEPEQIQLDAVYRLIQWKTIPNHLCENENLQHVRKYQSATAVLITKVVQSFLSHTRVAVECLFGSIVLGDALRLGELRTIWFSACHFLLCDPCPL